LEEKKKFENFKITFEKEKKNVENKNINESKNKIIQFIINNYIKLFLDEGDDDKSQFKTSLNESLSNFVTNFLKSYCQNFDKSFIINSKKIAEGYNVENNKFEINHINFVVIGKAGTGKSTLINSILLLPENKRAKEGDGTSITEKSTLYDSEKIQTIRMWDTQGIDYEITQNYILDEVTKLVNDGLEKGPDHYINIILYCTTGNRFQKEDGELIHQIMKLYPMENLPVIITQLQAYFKEDQKKMEKIIPQILKDHFDSNIIEKIPIKSVISRDKKEDDFIVKSKGIPDLLKCAFEISGRAISSATFKKYSEDIKSLCKEYLYKKNNFIQNI
jgi:predicted GTPase